MLAQITVSWRRSGNGGVAGFDTAASTRRGDVLLADLGDKIE